MLRLEFLREFIRAVNRDGETTNEIFDSRFSILDFRRGRNEIRQAMIELPRRFLHLLSQKIKRRQLFSVRFVHEKIDIIPIRACGPESKNTTRNQQFFRSDSIENHLRVVKNLARLGADRRVVKDGGVSSAQFPNMEEGRPINVFAKIGNCG